MHPLADQLIAWYEENKRDLPWRKTRDPYRVWLSEIILQQTRVEQGMPYYHSFTKTYPEVNSLAQADEDSILRLWQGLGYYSRARNLHKCAKIVVDQFEGVFPKDYKTLISLPGIGKYTASAISSICNDEPSPVIDGNVFRITTRYFGIFDDIGSPGTYKSILEILNDVIPHDKPGTFNQATMELGATVCKPRNPECQICPWNKGCYALDYSKIRELPFKKKKTKVRKRIFNYLVFEDKGRLSLKKRGNDDIWRGLYDFPVIESETNQSANEIAEQLRSRINGDFEISEPEQEYNHVLSHQKISARFYLIKGGTQNGSEMEWYDMDQIEELPKPVLIQKYLNDHSI